MASVNKNGSEEVKGCNLKVVRDHSSGLVSVQVAFFGKGKKQLLKSVCLCKEHRCACVLKKLIEKQVIQFSYKKIFYFHIICLISYHIISYQAFVLSVRSTIEMQNDSCLQILS